MTAVGTSWLSVVSWSCSEVRYSADDASEAGDINITEAGSGTGAPAFGTVGSIMANQRL